MQGCRALLSEEEAQGWQDTFSTSSESCPWEAVGGREWGVGEECGREGNRQEPPS